MLPRGLTLFIAAAVAGLLWCEARRHNRAAFLCKLSASLGFVALALVFGACRHGLAAQFIITALCLAALGDAALAVPGRRAFLVGLGLFFLGHAAYVAAFATLVPVPAWPTAAAAIPVAASVAAYIWLAPRLGRMRGPVLAYMATITVMVAGAIAVARAGVPGASRLFAGAVLYYLSDLCVGRDRFVKRAFVNRACGLPVYYAGQILFAWATAQLISR